MYKCLIIADDLTGANASISLLKNLKTTTLLELNDKNLYEDYDAISCSTESRAIPETDAYNKVFKYTKKYMHNDIIVYNKRIDSTMRGNIGIEIDAMLDALDDDRLAIVSPGYPDAGRIVVGGYLLVNGNLVEDTEMAVDSKNPVKISNCIELIKCQSKRKITSLEIDIVRTNSKVISEYFRDKYAEGFRIIVCDIVNQNHIKNISQAILESKIKFIVADPSPLMAQISYLSTPHAHIKNRFKKILCVIGSISQTTALQVKTLYSNRTIGLVRFRPENLIDSSLYEKEVNNIVNEVTNKFEIFDICLLVSENIYRDKPLDFDEIALISKTDIEYLSNLINERIAVSVEKILQKVKIGGLYTSGGDTTIKICSQLNSYSLDIQYSIFPLVVYAKLNGGKYQGLDLITKGGGVGDAKSLIKCVDFLIQK